MLREAFPALTLLLLTGGVVFGGQTANQSKNRVDNEIHGRVVLPDLPGTDHRLEVNLERTELQVIQSTYTDAEGNFSFNNLPPGLFYIVVNLDGYEPVRQLAEVVDASSHSAVTIMMSKSVAVSDRLRGLDAEDPDVVDITQMKDRFPKKAVQDYEKAIDEKQKGHTDSAIKLLESAIRQAPDFFHAHNNLGILYESVKRYTDAESEFKRSHELSPKTEKPLLNLGSLYIEQANLKQPDKSASGMLLDQALDALEEAVKLNPRSAPGYFLLSQANYKSSFWEEAETACRKALEIDPKLKTARLMLANIYVKEEKWQEVIDSLDRYLKDNPAAPDRAGVEKTRASVLKTMELSK